MNNNLYFRINTYYTNVFSYTFIYLTNLNNNVNTTIFSILVSEMAYTSDAFFPSDDALQSLYLSNIKNFLITLGKWLTETFFFCHISIKFKYLFLKSRKDLRKQRLCFVLQKVFSFLLVAFTFDAKVP